MRTTRTKKYVLFRRAVAVATMTVALVVAALPAVAQQPPAKPRKPYSNNNEYVGEKLDRPPDLPYLQQYPNADYTWIQAYRRQGQPIYSLTFNAHETPTYIMDWYKAAFKGNQWRVLAGGKKELTAERGGNTCNINLMNCHKKGYETGSVVYVIYKIREFVH